MSHPRAIPTVIVGIMISSWPRKQESAILSLGHHACLVGAWRVDVSQEIAVRLAPRAFQCEIEAWADLVVGFINSVSGGLMPF